MKVVVQKVLSASVTVDGEQVCGISDGLCIFVGFCRQDTATDVDYIVTELLDLRLFGDDTGGWDKSVKDASNEILCVSQFSLYTKIKGNSLNFHQAMDNEMAEVFYHLFLDKLRHKYLPDKIKDGRYGVKRIVNIRNDGPVLLTLESPINKCGDGEELDR